MRNLIYFTCLLFVCFCTKSIGQNLEVEGDGYISGQLQVGDLSVTGQTFLTVGTAGTSISGLKLRHVNDNFGFTIESSDIFPSQGLNIRRHVGSSAGISDMFIDLSGNIGIGMTTPMHKLDINGDLRVAGIISGVTDPVNAQDAATKAYVDLISSPCGLSIGDTHAGGMIFYLDASGCHGLVAAASDQSTGIEWSGSLVDTYAYGNGIGAGEGNSMGIKRWLGDCSSCNASELCQDLSLGGYSDWYLPSKYELNLMYENIGQGNSLGLGNVGGFSGSDYWSSTEHIFNVWIQDFTDGNQVSSNKSAENYVRAIRAF